jgi:hypothetical protein
LAKASPSTSLGRSFASMKRASAPGEPGAEVGAVEKPVENCEEYELLCECA